MSGPNRAWNEGYTHRCSGGRYVDNPYVKDTTNYLCWVGGYLYAKEIQYIYAYTA